MLTAAGVQGDAETGAFKLIEHGIELRIIAPLFDRPSGMGRSRAVAAKRTADLAIGRAEYDMGEIHRNLARKRHGGSTARAGMKLGRRDGKPRGDESSERLAVPAAQARIEWGQRVGGSRDDCGTFHGPALSRIMYLD